MKKKNKKNKKIATKLGVFQRNNDSIATPDYLYGRLNSIYRFDFDPCPLNFTKDGLSTDWGKRNFVNPPFSKIARFLDKAIIEMGKGNFSLFLVTTRTQSQYWERFVYPYATEFILLRPITFQGYDHPFPIPCCLLEFDPNKKPFFESKNDNDELKDYAFRIKVY